MNRFLQFVCFLLAFASTTAFSPAAPWGATAAARQRASSLSAVIEKEAPLKGPGPAVMEPETETGAPRTRDNRDTKKSKNSNESWEVRIYNDGLNTREHVARSLVQITGLSEMAAYSTMMQAHLNGIAVVGRWVYEIAEMYHEALRKQGIVCDLVPVDNE